MESPEWGIRVATAVHGVFSARYPPNRAQGLQASRWAPQQASSTPMDKPAAGPSGSEGPGKSLMESPWAPAGAKLVPRATVVSPSPSPALSSYHSASSSVNSFCSAHSYLSASSSSSPSPHQSPQLDFSLTSTRSSSRLASDEVSKMYQVANLDDTAGFMAAARALTQKDQANASSKGKDTSGSAKGESKSPRRSLSPSAPEFVPSSSSAVENSPAQGKNGSTTSSNFNPNAEEFVPSGANLAKEEIVNSAQGAGLDESDSKKKATASNDIVNITQVAGLNDSAAKKKMPTSGIKTSNVDDTSGFMAAARARFNKPDEETKVVASSNKIVNSAQDSGLNESDAKKKVTLSLNQIVKSTQDTGLADSDTKKNTIAYEIKTTSNVDDTAGFMAAARALRDGSSAKKEVTASLNEIVKSGTQDSGLVDSDANKATVSSNENVNSTQDTGLVDSDSKNKVSSSEIKMTTDIDDTAGFMAAARAWKSRNISPVYTHAVVKTPDQISDQTQTSPVKEPFNSSTKVKKASSRNDILGSVLGSEPTREKMSIASPNKPADADDAAGFMAAARALRSRNMPPVYTQVAAKTPDQMSGHMEQTQSSPVKESFATPTEKASSGHGISDGVVGSEKSDTMTYESPREKMSAASPNKFANVDDTAGFMAAVRALKYRSVSPTVYTQAVAKSPGQASNSIEFEDAKQTQSPVKESFKSSTKVEKTPSGNDTAGLDGAVGSESTREKASTAASNKPANVDDTVGFMAAARALKSRSVSPTVYTQTVAKTPDQQTQSSPVEEPFKSSTKVEKVSSGNNTAGLGGAPGSEESNPVIDGSPREKISTAGPRKLADVKDTAEFVAEACSLSRNPGLSAVFSKILGSSSNSGSGTNANDATKVEAKKEAVTDAAAGQALNTDSAKHSNTDNGAEATQAGVSASSEQSKHPRGKENDVDNTTNFLASACDLKDEHETVSYTCREKYSPNQGQAKNSKKRFRQLERVTNVEEDRENLITFKTWGTPAPRNKPPAQVRRVILTGLPRAWTNPSKALSIVHTGVIDKINVSPAGNAHIYFCDHKACKAFFDKYPNGIGIGPHNVYVELGTEVDVISSQLALNRSLGATRVIRAAGVDMNTTMSQLHQIASGQNRRVEKIVDSYIPGEARIVQFRFCSIEDAVRFRSKLVRDEAWETCNIQYGKDPCEVDAGSHIN